MNDRGSRLPDGTLKYLKEHQFEKQIELKESMLVVLLSNIDIDNGLVNGSQGQLIGFEEARSCSPRKQTTMIEDLRPPPAIISDQSGDYAHIKHENITTFISKAAQRIWPIVRFSNVRTRIIYAECRTSELGDEKPYSLISRTQIPLMAGYAITVHKSQGMTLNKVIVNLSHAFAEGQTYVALSRATSLRGLYVKALGKDIRCDEQIRKFWSEHFGWPCNVAD